MSLVYWSRINTFHTAGPGGLVGFAVEEDFVIVNKGLYDESTGLLRLSRVSRAFVCACCSVGGVALAYGCETGVYEANNRVREGVPTCLRAVLAMARPL